MAVGTSVSHTKLLRFSPLMSFHAPLALVSSRCQSWTASSPASEVSDFQSFGSPAAQWSKSAGEPSDQANVPSSSMSLLQ